MTHAELYVLFETELAELIQKGLSMPFVRPMLTDDGEHFPGFDHENPQPSTHELWCERPFVFDIRKLPDTFYGFKLYTSVPWNARPEPFRPKNHYIPEQFDALNYKPYEDIFLPEKVMVYALKHAKEIRAELNDPTFTIKNICDMIVWRDFNEHKREYWEWQLRHSLNSCRWHYSVIASLYTKTPGFRTQNFQ